MALRHSRDAALDGPHGDSMQDSEPISQSDVLNDNAGSDSDTAERAANAALPRKRGRPPSNGGRSGGRGRESRNGSRGGGRRGSGGGRSSEIRATSTIAGPALGSGSPAAAIAALSGSYSQAALPMGAHLLMQQAPQSANGASGFASGASGGGDADAQTKELRLQALQYHLAMAQQLLTEDDMRRLRPIAQALNSSNVIMPLIAAPWLTSSLLAAPERSAPMPAPSASLVERFLSTGGHSSRDLVASFSSDPAHSELPDRDPFPGAFPDSPRALKRQKSDAAQVKAEPVGGGGAGSGPGTSAAVGASPGAGTSTSGALGEAPGSPRRPVRKPGPPSSRDKVWDLLTDQEKTDILSETLSAAEGTKLLLVRRADVLGCAIEEIPEEDDWGINFKLSECKATSEPLDRPKNCSICLRQGMVFHRHSYYCRRCAQLYRAIHRKKCNLQDEQGLVVKVP